MYRKIECTSNVIARAIDRSPKVWVALSTSHVKAQELPPDPARLIVATDGEAARRGAGNVLATRATSHGWKASLLRAPDGLDWNDVLMRMRVAA